MDSCRTTRSWIDRLALRGSTLLAGSLALALGVACGAEAPSRPAAGPTAAGPDAAGATAPGRAVEPAAWLYLTDIGIRHENGASGEFFFPEIAGAGGALLDYDGDGDLDLYVVQGGSVPGAARDEAGQAQLGADRLYRTDAGVGSDGRRTVEWVDVTEAAGIAAAGYGMGVAVGDIDNDGAPDFYVTNAGANQLWRNRGDGTFEEVTRSAGVSEVRWSTSATFFDYDNDGWLDLYVANYVDFRLETHRECRSTSGAPDYCGPLSFNPESDRLWRNRGDGTFEDMSEEAGIAELAGTGLGVTAADFNGDGWSDLFVANDQMVNFLWMNRGDGTFAEEAALAGCAVNMEGNEEASMGVVAADFDEDGALDLFMTHLDGETNTLYMGDGTGLFRDRTAGLGLAAPSLPSTGFGTTVTDYDLDGWQDIYVANGAVYTIEEQRLAGDPFPFRQPDQLFLNQGGTGFVEIEGSSLARSGGHEVEVGRGVASGDRLRVGFPMLVVFNNGGPVHLVDLVASPPADWLGIDARAIGGRAALGATVSVELATGPRRYRRVHRDGSYCSSGDPAVLVGLGDTGAAESVRIDWPSGGATVLGSPPVGHYLRVIDPAARK